MFLTLILFLITIQIHYGLLSIKPDSYELKIIRVLSILVILFSLVYNYNNNYGLCFLLPLSIDKISYLDVVLKTEKVNITVDNEVKTKLLYLTNANEISDFLKTLGFEDDYIANIEFIPSIEGIYIDDGTHLFISKPFLINRGSSTKVISKFIDERLFRMVDKYYLDDTIINNSEFCVKLSYSKLYFI